MECVEISHREKIAEYVKRVTCLCPHGDNVCVPYCARLEQCWPEDGGKDDGDSSKATFTLDGI